MSSLWLIFSCLCIISHHGIAKPNSPKIECVDIYKQPAFQDPSMKNHRISSFALQTIFESDDTNIANVVSTTIKCPKGQVPIHKPVNNITDHFIHLDHLAKTGRVLAQQSKGSANITLHHAILTPRLDPGKKFNGGKATFGLCKPPNNVAKGQFSKASIWIINAKGNIYNSIQYGWAVHPGLYGDNIPRLTAFWTKTRQDGCYNANCGGFVQSHATLHLGMPMDDTIKVGVKKQYPTLSVELIRASNEWALTVGGAIIGYWPKMFFPELNGGATQVHYGGYVAAPPGAVSPPMGFGAFPTKDYKTSCFMKELEFTTYIDYDDIDPKKITVVSDRPKCYGINYLNYLGPFDRHTITFGGPGGQCN